MKLPIYPPATKTAELFDTEWSEQDQELKSAFWKILLTSSSAAEVKLKLDVDGRFREQYDGMKLEECVEMFFNLKKLTKHS